MLNSKLREILHGHPPRISFISGGQVLGATERFHSSVDLRTASISDAKDAGKRAGHDPSTKLR